MPFQLPPRLSSVLASVLAAGLMLTVAGCRGQLTPLGPYSAATLPQPHHLRSPFVLQAMRAQPLRPAGGCPAGYVALSGATSGQCYRKTGTPVTITSAAVSPVPSSEATPDPGLPGADQYNGFLITMPAADAPALTAVSTTAVKARGALAISMAGRTWVLPTLGGPWPSQQLGIFLPRNQLLQLQRLLAWPG
jgi:hypothetical protein